MTHLLRRQTALLLLAVLVAACAGRQQGSSGEQRGSLGEQQAIDAAWEAFKPNTSSGDRTNWEVAEVRKVTGRSVSAQFAGQAAPGCWVGPTPVPNQEIASTRTYWYVQFTARPATPLPRKGTVPPTAPPLVPEAFVRKAEFLLERTDGQVVARKIYCIIY